VRDAAQRVGILERALKLAVEDRVDLAGLVAAGVADEPLARGIGPAGSVGDQLAVVADEQSADDLPERVELGVARVHQPGADVVPEPEVAAGRLGVPGPRPRSALGVLRGGVAELAVVEAGARDVRLLAGGRGLVVLQVLVGEGGASGPPRPASKLRRRVLLVGIPAVESLMRPLVHAPRPDPRMPLAEATSARRGPGSGEKIIANGRSDDGDSRIGTCICGAFLVGAPGFEPGTSPTRITCKHRAPYWKCCKSQCS
jgi:hypothetical protein